MSCEFRFLTTEFLASSKPQAEIIIVKRSIQGRNNVTSVWVEHRLCNQSCRKKALALLAMLLGDSQKDSWSLLITKKTSFLAKAVKIQGEPKVSEQ